MQRSIIAPAERVTNLRWGMAILIGIGLLLASLSMVTVSVSYTALSRDLGLTPEGYGNVLAAFNGVEALALLAVAFVLDRIGSERIGRVWPIAFGILAVATAFVPSAGVLVGAAALLGIARAPGNPTGLKAIGYWFPLAERSTASACIDAAAKLAFGIGIPLMAWIGMTWSWRMSFLAIGIATLLYAIAYLVFYRDPADQPKLTHAEAQHLVRGGAQAAGPPAGVNLFAQRKVWGLAIGAFALAYSLSTFLTWLPSYLATTLHVGVFPTALAAGIPWIIAAIADVVIGGLLVDTLVKRGMDATRVRYGVLILGAVLALAVYGAGASHDPSTALACITIAIAGAGIAGPIAGSIATIIAPRGQVGAVAAVMSFAALLAVIAAPIVSGRVFGATGTFDGVFFTAAGVLLIGLLSFVFLLGRVESIDAPETAGILI